MSGRRRTTLDTDPGPVVIGAYLRALRQGHGLTSRDAARLIRRTPKILALLEKGQTVVQGPTRSKVAVLLRAYGVADEDAIDAVLALVPPPYRPESDTRCDRRRDARDRLAACWYMATTVRVHSNWWLPPSVQTPAYALAYAGARQVKERHGPGSVRFPPPTPERRLTLLVDEEVLDRPVGGPGVMAEQIAHLQRLAEMGSLVVRIVPAGRTQQIVPVLSADLTLPRCRLHVRQTLPPKRHVVYYSADQAGVESRAVLDQLEESAASPGVSYERLDAALRTTTAGVFTASTAERRAHRVPAVKARSAGAPASDAPAGRRVAGIYLRALRTGRDLSQTGAARLVRRSGSMLSRMEAGLLPIHPDIVTALLREYGVVGAQEIESVIRLARDATSADHHDDGPGARDRLAACWGAATAVRTYADDWLPHPVQTPAYAKECTERHGIAPRYGPGTFRFPPPCSGRRLTLLMGEAVLRRPIGGPEVMSQQIAHLRSLIDAGSLLVQVLPFDSDQLPGRQITELHMPDSPLYATEGAGGVTYRADEYPGHALDRLQRAALTVQQSVARMDLARRTTFAPRRSA